MLCNSLDIVSRKIDDTSWLITTSSTIGLTGKVNAIRPPSTSHSSSPMSRVVGFIRARRATLICSSSMSNASIASSLTKPSSCSMTRNSSTMSINSSASACAVRCRRFYIICSRCLSRRSSRTMTRSRSAKTSSMEASIPTNISAVLSTSAPSN